MHDSNLFEAIDLLFRSSCNFTDEEVFEFDSEITAQRIKEEFSKSNIKFDTTYASNEIKLEQNTIKIYKSYESFINQFPQIMKSSICKNIHCVFNNSKLIILEKNNEFVESYFFRADYKKKDYEISLSNVFYFELIKESLIQISYLENYDDVITLITPNYLPQRIKLQNYGICLNNLDLSKINSKLKNTINKLDNKLNLLKNRIADFVEKIDDDNIKFLELIKSLDCICDETIADFEITVSEIDFDSCIQRFRNEISNLFSSTREIFEKILAYAISLAIALSGMFFTVNSSIEKKEIIPFLITALIIYTLFSCCILVYYLFDLKQISRKTKKIKESYTKGSSYLENYINDDVKSLKYRRIFILIVIVILIVVFIVVSIFSIKILLKLCSNVSTALGNGAPA